MNQTKHLFHIILAEDDEDDRMLFSDALSEVDSSATLIQAENGKDLMLKLRQQQSEFPDVIFLDLNMPLQNGYECLKEIRNTEPPLRNLRIIALTTNANKDNIDTVYNLGASFYIVKPGNFSGLKSVIAKVLNMEWLTENRQPDRQHFVLTA